MLAPIALFAFNRPMHFKRTLSALAANDLAAESDMTIFCDGPRHEEEKKLTDAVREVAACAVGFHSITIITHEQNLGCAESVIGGMEYMFTRHERLIVIEDDILCSPFTLRFLNEGLEKYIYEPVVFNISAWSPPQHLLHISKIYPFSAYFIPRFNCWGWASWRDRWKKIDWKVSDYTAFKKETYLQKNYCQGGDDLLPMLTWQMEGLLDSWSVRMNYARFKHGCIGLNPVYSHTTNIGMRTGTHCRTIDIRLDNDITLACRHTKWPNYIFVDAAIAAAYRKVYSRPSVPIRAVNKISHILFRKNITLL
jgi:hypothetical protein